MEIAARVSQSARRGRSPVVRTNSGSWAGGGTRHLTSSDPKTFHLARFSASMRDSNGTGGWGSPAFMATAIGVSRLATSSAPTARVSCTTIRSCGSCSSFRQAWHWKRPQLGFAPTSIERPRRKSVCGSVCPAGWPGKRSQPLASGWPKLCHLSFCAWCKY